MKVVPKGRAWIRALHLVACGVLVSACGGGGGGGGDAAQPPATPAAVKPVTLTGTAATGAAIANAAVAAKCASGTATTTTAADGSFKVDLGALVVPCALRVTSGNGTTLHSIASGAVATITANITPASELVVARLTGVAPASFFASFDAAAAAAITDAKVQAADAAVVDVLKNAGVDLSAAGSALSGTLVAANGSTAGNAYDKALDTLKATLAGASTTLAAYTASVAATSPASPSPAATTTPSVPPDLLLNPAALNCASLRSGNYWMVMNGVGRNRLKIDASALTVAVFDATTGAAVGTKTLTPMSTCRYKGFAGEVAFSPAGVGVVNVTDVKDVNHGALIFPAQRQTPSDLAGEWNLLGMDETPLPATPVALVSQTAIIDGSGKVTASTVCTGVSSGCKAGTAGQTFTANATGSLDVRGADGSYTEAFAYRSGSGELMLLVSMPKTFLIGVRKSTAVLPAVGRVEQAMLLQLETLTNPFYAIADTRSAVTAVDIAAGRYTRALVLDLASGLTRPETIAANDPSAGFLRRLPATVTASDGSSSTVRETVMLNLPGAGLGVTAFVGGTALQLSVSK